MTKNKKIESYGKLPTSELLNIDREVLTDNEEDALNEEIDERLPFSYITNELAELREMVEELQTEFGKHDHKDSEVVIRKK